MTRMELQSALKTILGSNQVYFQAPENKKMSYPAIVYELNDIQDVYANNSTYLRHKSYSVTLMDKNPDSEFIEAIANLPKSKFNRFFVTENINHWVFTIFI